MNTSSTTANTALHGTILVNRAHYYIIGAQAHVDRAIRKFPDLDLYLKVDMVLNGDGLAKIMIIWDGDLHGMVKMDITKMDASTPYREDTEAEIKSLIQDVIDIEDEVVLIGERKRKEELESRGTQILI